MCLFDLLIFSVAYYFLEEKKCLSNLSVKHLSDIWIVRKKSFAK